MHEDFIIHGIRDEATMIRSQSVGDNSKPGIKIGMSHAATFAGAAEVARPAAVNRLGAIGIARRHNGAAELFLDAIAEKSFLARERNRGLKLAIGSMFEALDRASDADEFLDENLVRLVV